MPTELTVASWNEFVTHIEGFAPEPSNPYGSRFFRGQEKNCSTWRLLPTIARQLRSDCALEQAVGIEGLLLREFRQDGHRNLPNWEVPDPGGKYPLLGWVMAMRQYGAPTRLLDWTFSPYVAAYIAVREAPKADGVVWMHNYSALVDALQVHPKTEVSLPRIENALAGKIEQPSDPPGICALFQKERRPARMCAQQGFYMVCEDPTRAHDEVMAEIAKKAGVEPFLHRIVIASAAKLKFLANLRMMNITSASLFPGPDGLGRDVGEFAKIVAEGLAKPHPENPEDSAGGSGTEA